MEGTQSPKDKWETIHRNLPSEDFHTNLFDPDSAGNFYGMYESFMRSEPLNGAKAEVDKIANKFYGLAAKKIAKDSKVRLFISLISILFLSIDHLF